MAAEPPRSFEERLCSDIAELRRLQFAPENAPLVQRTWAEVWNQFSDEQFFMFILKYTVPAAKVLLGRAESPSKEEFENVLSPIGTDKSPGVYLCVVSGPYDKEGSELLYVGSGTYPVEGLYGRVRRHLDRKARDVAKKKGTALHIYNALDKEGMERKAVFRKLLVGVFGDRSDTTVLFVRAACLVAENLFAAWFLAFAEDAMRLYRPFCDMSPWTASKLTPSNLRPPVTQHIKLPKPGSIAPLNLSEQHHRYQAKLDRTQTDDEKAIRKKHNLAYSQHVKTPCNQARRAGKTDDEIDAIRAEGAAFVRKMAPTVKQWKEDREKEAEDAEEEEEEEEEEDDI